MARQSACKLEGVLAIVLATALAIFAPSAGLAATQCINSNAPAPLEICVQDNARPAVWVNQPNNGRVRQYYSDYSWGSVIRLNGTDNTQRYGTGYGGGPIVTAVSNATTGTGTASDPYIITTVVNVGSGGVRMTQKFAYVNGDRFFHKTWTLQNTGGSTFNDVRFFHGGDTYFGGSDSARSWYDTTTNMVYVTNQTFTDTGYMGFYANPATPSSAYFGGYYSAGTTAAFNTAQLPSTADSSFVDAGYYLQWNRATLAPGDTWNIDAYEIWSPPGALQVISPAGQYITSGTTVRQTFKVQNLDVSTASVTVTAATTPSGWTVSFPNPTTFDVATNAVQAVPVDITVPAGVSAGAIEDVTLTATAGSDVATGSTRLSVVQPDYTISPTTLNFPTVAPGSTSDLAVTLTNSVSGVPVQIATLASADSLAAPFSIQADSCSNTTVAAGASCSVTVRFAPTNTSAANDTFSFPTLSPFITSQPISVIGNPPAPQFTVTGTAGTGGSIGPASVSVSSGLTTSFAVTADTGYSIGSVSGCGGSLSGNTYTTGPITVACAVNATFTVNQYTVTSVAGAGGGISPATAQVSFGAPTTFNVTPGVGYSIDSVSGCGGSLSGNTYTTAIVSGPCTVTASFAINQYSVTASAGTGGTISPASSVVTYGSTTTFTLSASTGQRITGVTGCDGVLTGNTYTTSPVLGNCSVSATFGASGPTFQPSVLPLREVNATGLITTLPSDIAPAAVDANGNAVEVSLESGVTQFGPGDHVLVWHAVDAAGRESTIQQVLRIWPTVSAGPDVSVKFVAGNTSSFRISLNGPAPAVPFMVSYTVTGATTGTDLASGSVQFAAGETAKDVPFAITTSAAAGSAEQDAIVSLDDGVNLGVRSMLTVHLLAKSLPPVVTLLPTQGGQRVPIFERGSGPVTIQADIRDPDSENTYQVKWTAPNGATVTPSGDSLIFDPSSLPAGTYRFEALVTDNSSPPLITRGTFDLVVADKGGTLPAGATGWTDSGLPQHPDYQPPARNVLPERGNELHHFLVEGDAGLELALGATARAQDMDQAELAAATIPPDTVTNVGGFFDFVVSNLPAVAQSVRVVLPQRRPIPAHPVYRKYALLEKRWKNFTEDSTNSLASAPGAEGFCPPPGSSAYRAGLNPGDWCVQLTMSDGGPNDDDGEANGVLNDPGGVGSLATVVVTTSGKGGGGALDWLTITMLVLIVAAVRRRSRAMWKCIAGTLLITASALANADTSWYGGFEAGPARGDVTERDVNSRLAAAGYEAHATFSSLHPTAWRAFAGFRPATYVSVEAGFTDLGTVRTRLAGNVVDIQSFLNSATELHPHSAQGFEGLARARYPIISERFWISGRVGILHWESRYGATNEDGELSRLKASGTGLQFGAGLEVAVYRGLHAGVNWTSYRVDRENIGFTGFGLSYDFD